MPGHSRHLLILGGTAEASALADAAAVRFGNDLRITVSLAGRTRAPKSNAGYLRIGGFGGAGGLADWLRAEQVDMAVDATHPFAADISAHLRAACVATATPRLILSRPPWAAEPGDRWITVPDFAAAAAALPGLGRRVFLSVGSQKLAAFAGLDRIHLLVRMIDPPATPLPLADYVVVIGRGPFDLAAEIDLLRRERIDAIVSRNSGGKAIYAKIAAARELDLPVVMVAPPPREPGPCQENVEGTLQWIATELAAVAC